MAVSIRPARLEDAPALAALCGQLGYPATEGELRPRLDTLLAAEGPVGAGRAALFVAVADGNVAGWVHAYRCELLESEGEAEIGGLVVDEAHRHAGLGGALMDRAEAWAAGAGCRAVRLRSNVIREAAHAFYEARGYRRFKSQHVFRRDLAVRAPRAPQTEVP